MTFLLPANFIPYVVLFHILLGIIAIFFILRGNKSAFSKISEIFLVFILPLFTSFGLILHYFFFSNKKQKDRVQIS